MRRKVNLYKANIPGLLDFAMGLVDSLLNMPNRQVEFFRGMQITEVKQVNYIVKFLIK